MFGPVHPGIAAFQKGSLGIHAESPTRGQRVIGASETEAKEGVEEINGVTSKGAVEYVHEKVSE